MPIPRTTPSPKIQCRRLQDLAAERGLALSIGNSAGILAVAGLPHRLGAARDHALRVPRRLPGTAPRSWACEPVMTLGTQLIAVQQLRRGDAIGYGGTWRCPEDMPVGIAAVGYGDGYPRHAPSGTPVLVRGVRCPLVGRVSMDMISLDLRPLPDAQPRRPGDPVGRGAAGGRDRDPGRDHRLRAVSAGSLRGCRGTRFRRERAYLRRADRQGGQQGAVWPMSAMPVAARLPKWAGQCPDCGAWNTVAEVPDRPPGEPRRGGYAGVAGAAQIQSLSAVVPEAVARIGTGVAELDRVLGGGLVPGSVVLLGGDPGIGKSTLLLQACAALGAADPVLYVTGEESPQQVSLRARRLGLTGEGIRLLAETCVERVLEAVEVESPRVMVVDSIQTLFAELLPVGAGVGLPGARDGRAVGAVRQTGGHGGLPGRPRHQGRGVWPGRGSWSTWSTRSSTSRGRLAGPSAWCGPSRTASARSTSWVSSR